MLKRIDECLGKEAPLLIIGDVMLDRYIRGRAERISPEAPVPVLRTLDQHAVPGGAGNVAMNLVQLNARVTLVGMTGEDHESVELQRLLENAGIENRFCSVGRPTVTKTRLMSGHQQMMRVDQEDSSPLCDREQDRVIELLDTIDFSQYSAVVISDYAKGICFERMCQTVIRKSGECGIPVLVDPKNRNWDRYRGAALVTPNMKELSLMAGREVENSDQEVVEVGQWICERYSLDHLLVTRSEKGMTLITSERMSSSNDMAVHIATRAQEVCDVSGAGDTVVACTARMLASGCPIHEAIVIANEAAGSVVSRVGTSPISAEELRAKAALLDGQRLPTFDAVVPMDRAGELAAALRDRRKRIIFTNGCFDLLHRGHLHYLKQARALGDLLIVGLNSDDSVRRLKGPERPINDEQSRALMLSSLEFVDYVVLFEQDTPEELIRAIHPDVLVKGGDNRIEDIPGRHDAKETLVMPFVDGFSSTNIITKVRESMQRDADERRNKAA